MLKRVVEWAAWVILLVVGAGWFLILSVEDVIPARTIWHSDGSSSQYQYNNDGTVTVHFGRYAPFVDSSTVVDLKWIPLVLILLGIGSAWVLWREGNRNRLRKVLKASPFVGTLLVLRMRSDGFWLGTGMAIIAMFVVGLFELGLLMKNLPTRGQRRLARRLCPVCGYDIRATAEGGDLLVRCPECGEEILPGRFERAVDAVTKKPGWWKG